MKKQQLSYLSQLPLSCDGSDEHLYIFLWYLAFGLKHSNPICLSFNFSIFEKVLYVATEAWQHFQHFIELMQRLVKLKRKGTLFHKPQTMSGTTLIVFKSFCPIEFHTVRTNTNFFLQCVSDLKT